MYNIYRKCIRLKTPHTINRTVIASQVKKNKLCLQFLDQPLEMYSDPKKVNRHTRVHVFCRSTKNHFWFHFKKKNPSLSRVSKRLCHR